MGYIDSAPYFLMATETVASLANKAISQRYQAGEHPLYMASEARAVNKAIAPKSLTDTSWEHLLADQRAAAKSNVYIYLDKFISIVQGVPRER